MRYTISAIATDNPQVRRLLDVLSDRGIERSQIEVLADKEEHEHHSDRRSRWSTGGVVVGVLGGAFIGWLALSWSPLAPIGALWVAVVGALIGGRAMGYAAVDADQVESRPAEITPTEVLVAVHTEHYDEVESIKEALADGGGTGIACAEESSAGEVLAEPDDGVEPPRRAG